jgi:hypothetical protein
MILEVLQRSIETTLPHRGQYSVAVDKYRIDRAKRTQRGIDEVAKVRRRSTARPRSSGTGL